MENCIGKKTEYNKKAFAALSVFFILRAIFISSGTRTGVETDPPSVSFMPVNGVYLFLTAVFGILLAHTLCTAYRKSEKAVLLPLLFIAADPVLPYSFLNCISLTAGIALLLGVINILSDKPAAGKTAAAVIFMIFSGLLMPSALYVFVPLFLMIYFPGNFRKNIIPVVLSLAAFGISALINGIVLSGSYEIKRIMTELTFSENTALVNTDVSVSSSPAAKLSFLFIAAAVFYFIFKFKSIKTEKMPDKKRKDLQKNEIFNAAFLLINILLIATGVFLCGMDISVLTLIAVWYIALIRANDSIARKSAEKIYDFLINRYYILVILLCISSVILLNIKNPGSIYSSAANSFI